MIPNFRLSPLSFFWKYVKRIASLVEQCFPLLGMKLLTQSEGAMQLAVAVFSHL